MLWYYCHLISGFFGFSEQPYLSCTTVLLKVPYMYARVTCSFSWVLRERVTQIPTVVNLRLHVVNL